ncbi:transglutaminase-like domain-containing protein [Geomonas oryzisoli]|uniref:Transglutaminase-like domain-containing protein n=1 Tax=Geomonas oryzisoli TaxID=2847992 RepID=A0ABX8J3R9_9BACT|nr:transglutaminase-like domain-containing protein [Geomonas oryzisoli]QWV93070.1 transglutaminase-like domain-containing protein [Geomonas oryzisoli]
MTTTARFHFSLRLMAILALVLLPLQLLAAAPLPKLAAPPEGERWFSIIMGDDQVGFGQTTVTRTAGGYQISSRGSVKMKVMGFSREASSTESYQVAPDLTLRSFQVENRIDGSPVEISGDVTAKGITVRTHSANGNKERTLKVKGAVYPPHALNLYPLMQGAVPGKTYKIQYLDPEAVKVKQAKVEVVGPETLDGKQVVHLKNDLYTMVDNDIWVDFSGNVLKESVRDGLVLTLARDEAAARAELAEAAMDRKDLVYDFSLIRITPPLEHPERLQKLVVQITGIPAQQRLLQGAWQRAERQPDGSVIFVLPNPAPAAEELPTQADLQPGERTPSDNPEIVARMMAIVGDEKVAPAQKVARLTAWVATQIKADVIDSQSPLETLQKGRGNCQSHARLYASLARAAGIPTRFVSGLVYQGDGFLYHSWAESYLEGKWVSVDPTFNQVPADVTHIKLIEGDSLDELGSIAGMIGRARAKVLEKR